MRIVGCLLAVALVMNSTRAAEFDPSRVHAVIVGVLEWKHGLAGFPKGNRKDQELRDLLVKRGTPAENISLLLDQDATLPNIRKALAKTLDRAPAGSTLIVYYAGHGWACRDGDFGFANYEVQSGKRDTEWRLRDLGQTLVQRFKGDRVFLWADCCFSGGLEIVVDSLAQKKIAACNLTSAGTANTSTNNWTFTQCIIDALRGDPLVDADGDGTITLAEMNVEVREAMRHLEGQRHGFKSAGLSDDFIMARATGPRPRAANATIAPGQYVQVGGKFGRVVAADPEGYAVQFYAYTEKVRQRFPANRVALSTRDPGRRGAAFAAIPAGNVKSDCEVEWQGRWWPAVVVKKEKDRWFIHYVGYDTSWDEWVGKDRIRFPKR